MSREMTEQDFLRLPLRENVSLVLAALRSQLGELHKEHQPVIIDDQKGYLAISVAGFVIWDTESYNDGTDPQIYPRIMDQCADRLDDLISYVVARG